MEGNPTYTPAVVPLSEKSRKRLEGVLLVCRAANHPDATPEQREAMTKASEYAVQNLLSGSELVLVRSDT
jgi:hypothetical protein